MKCPDVETLIAALTSGTDRLDASVAEHILTCPACRETVELIHDSMLGPKWANPERRYAEVPDGIPPLPSWDGLGEVPEMVLYLAGMAEGGARRYATWRPSVMQTDVRRPEALAMTRALGDASAETQPRKMSFVKREADCSLRVEVDVTPRGATVTLKLLSPSDEPLLPFVLSVRDVETGKLLLDGRSFKSGAAVLKGIERGRYAVWAESQGRVCRFSFEVQ